MYLGLTLKFYFVFLSFVHANQPRLIPLVIKTLYSHVFPQFLSVCMCVSWHGFLLVKHLCDLNTSLPLTQLWQHNIAGIYLTCHLIVLPVTWYEAVLLAFCWTLVYLYF